MRPFPADLIPMWPISTRVNKPESADPSIVEPIALESPYRTVATASSSRPPQLLQARQPHCRRTTLIVFYLIGAILRGSLGRQP
jgi:hypothetical protein